MKKFPLTTLAAAMLAAPIGASAAGLVLSGYVDTSYTYLSSAGAFNSGSDGIGGNGGNGAGTPSRVYDREHNSFNLNSVSLIGDFDSGDGWGGFVQLDFGNDAAVNESFANYTFSDEFTVQEANARYKADKWTFIGGKFATLAGAEVIESYQNWNFSRSILFGYTIPFTHTGVRAAFAPSTALTFFGGINNGWDQLDESNGGNTAGNGSQADGKTIELGLAWAPSQVFALNAALYSGDEAASTEVGRRDVLDVVATIDPNGPLSFKVDVVFGMQEDAVINSSGNVDDADWTGIAGYINWQMNPKWRLAGRLEQMDDDDGFRTGVAQKWSEGTVTVAFAPNTNVELRAEARMDQSDVDDAFLDADGVSDDDTQTSLALEGIVRF